MKKVFLVFAVTSMLIGCSNRSSLHDAECERLVSQPGSQEAQAWLASGEHNIGEYTPASSIAHVKDLYARGALVVTAVKLEKMEGGREWTDLLVITLPSGREQRTALFSVEAEWDNRSAVLL